MSKDIHRFRIVFHIDLKEKHKIYFIFLLLFSISQVLHHRRTDMKTIKLHLYTFKMK